MYLKISLLLFLISINVVAQDDINQSIEKLKTVDDLEEKQEVLLSVVKYYQTTNKNKDSVLHYLEYPIAIKKDSLFYAKLSYMKARYYNSNSQFDLSIKAAEDAARIYGSNKDSYNRAKAKSLQGSVYQAMFKNQQAVASYDEARGLLEGRDRIQLLSGYGAVYSQLNDLDQSIDYYKQAYDASVEEGIDDYLFNIHNGMAVVYYKNEDEEQSKNSLKKALEAAKKQGYSLGQVIVLHNLGHKYQTEEDYTSAITYFKEAISLIDQVDYKFIEGQIYYKYADCLIEINQLEEASLYAQKAENIFIEMESSGRLPYALRTKAKIERLKGNVVESTKILEEAIDISSTNEISSITSDLYLNLADNYRIRNDADKTFDAYANFTRISDSLARRIKSSEIEKVKSKFEASERENKLSQDNALLAAKNTTSYYRNILLAFALLGVIFFFYRQRRINKAKEKVMQQEKEIVELNEKLLQDKVKHKNTQITEYAILIDERNKFLDVIKTHINKIKGLADDNQQKSMLNELLYFIKDTLDVKREKVDLDKNFKNPEENFRFNLEQRFPKLTEKEVVICRLLMLNLTSKQMAQKMGINVQSVNNYRSSIRKKIVLGEGENLKRFLKNISG